MRQTLLEYLYENAANATDIALSHRPRLRRHRWTYQDLARYSFKFARELETRNIGRGDRVLIWAENSPEWVAAFYGILLRGAIAVPLDEQGSRDFAIRVIEKTRPKLLLNGSSVDCTAFDLPSIPLEGLVAAVADHSADIYETEEVRPTDVIEIVFTSGTTATPKGVELTHENLLANIAPIEREIGKYIRWEVLVHPLKFLTVLPLSHVFGQMIGIFIPQILTATVVFQNRLNPSEIIESIRRERVSILAAVPRILETLKNKIENEPELVGKTGKLNRSLETKKSWIAAWWTFRGIHRIFGWKFFGFVTGGATLDESIEEFWRQLGFAVVQGYGMTETAALVSLNNPFSSRRGSLGQVLTGRQNVRIGENGEILVRGNSVSAGYWGEQKRIEQEWLDTGDIGSLDETGRLYFKGRKKETIVTAAGLNIYPEDLEAALNNQPEIVASAVVGIDLGVGPEPAAALIVHPGCDVAPALARTNHTLAGFQRIRHWIEWPDADFPRTSTQKIRKTEIADVIMQDLSADAKVANEPSSVLGGILGRFNNTAAAKITPNAELAKDLNLDSLSRVELLSAIEDRYQIDLDEGILTESTTVDELERIVRVENRPVNRRKRFAYPLWPLRFPVSWLRIVFYYLVTFPITLILCRVDRVRLENLDHLEGPIVFVSNHITYVDPGLIMSALPGRFLRRLAIAMDGERLMGYRHPPPGTSMFLRIRQFLQYWLVVALFNTFPLPRRSAFRQSFSFAGEAMDRGYNILIFPEGELTKDGQLQPFRGGIGILAGGLEAHIVPVSIQGLYDLKERGQRLYAPAGSVRIVFGSPISIDRSASPKEITTIIEQSVAALNVAS